MKGAWLRKVRPGSAREHHWIGWSLGWAGLLLVLDQVSKVAVEHSFVKYESRPLIDGFFSLTYVTNRGAA